MRVLFITAEGVADPSSRVRLLQFVPPVRAQVGPVSVVVMHARNKLAARFKQAVAIIRARRADVVVLQRLASAPFIRGLHRANPRLIWDIDDGIFVGCPDVDTVTHLFERVVVGNRFLGDHVATFNANVTLIPTTVDESRFPLSDPPPAGDGPVTIGWIGHGGSLVNLEPLRPAFEVLHAAHPGRFALKVVSSRPFDFGPGGPPVVNKPWKLDEELADVRTFDVGIMPLADTDWNRFKCGYKAMLYLSQGRPAVLSPVGFNADLVADGVNGFLATTPDEWADRLGRLVADPALRHRLGAAGRRTIADHYTVAAVMPTWADVLRGTVCR